MLLSASYDLTDESGLDGAARRGGPDLALIVFRACPIAWRASMRYFRTDRPTGQAIEEKDETS